MSFWSTVGEVLKAVAEGCNPNNHYRNGYEHGLNGNARFQYPIVDRTDRNAQITVACERAYHQGYDDGVRQRMLNSLR